MPSIFSRTETVGRTAFDLYFGLEARYSEKFLYVERDDRIKVMGLGRVPIDAPVASLTPVREGKVRRSPALFSVGVFDPDDARPANPLFAALGGAEYVLPEVVVIEGGGKTFVQINGVTPVAASIPELLASVPEACGQPTRDIDHTVIADDRDAWFRLVDEALRRIRSGALDKVVLARELRVETRESFSSREMVANLRAAGVHGTLLLHEVDGVFFLGATPELLVRKQGREITTMCLAGTTAVGESEEERVRGAVFLLGDEKNLREHAYVADHLRGCLDEMCSKVRMPEGPSVLTLKHLQHLYTPVTAKVPRGVSLIDLRDRLHPTPALAGSPVDAARAAIRELEGFNRGLYGGTFGYVDLDGDGEFSVAIRSGVFTRDHGYVYAGCGIVEGSDPAAEYDETAVKLKTILSAFRSTPSGRTDG
ncbi:MAG: isochorismate synthase [Actinobacteria bacterium]|nr:MAG: isochorismate synthase [Actinomycetota bacterium]